MHWLGRRLGYRKLEDWYHIKTDDFRQNHGASVLESHWHSSAIAAVMECFPEHDWKEWLFDSAPRNFWGDHNNRRRYMQWLREQLGYRGAVDWYQVSNQDFRDHKGGAFLLHYDSTVSAAAMDYMPRYDWKEWLFSRTPKGFWLIKKNRRRYMQWLADRLDFKRPSDWYGVTDKDFKQNSGGELLKLFGSSPMAVVMDCYPSRTWHEWMFARVPVGFWEKPENRLRYVEWVGKRLRINRREDWSKVRRKDLCDNFGGALLARYRSYTDLLSESVPGLQAGSE